VASPQLAEVIESIGRASLRQPKARARPQDNVERSISRQLDIHSVFAKDALGATRIAALDERK
jgi:hypothetical protein